MHDPDYDRLVQKGLAEDLMGGSVDLTTLTEAASAGYCTSAFLADVQTAISEIDLTEPELPLT